MDIYLVFGDPRMGERRTVLMKSAAPRQLAIEGVAVRISVDGQVFDGGLLGSRTGAQQNSNYVSVLVSESQPPAATVRSLLEQGWATTDDLPRPEHLPFMVSTTLLTPGPRSTETWTKNLWFPHAFVPTQRTRIRLGGAPVEVACLAMVLRRDAAHQAVFVTETPLQDASGLDADGWLRAPSRDIQWDDVRALAAGIEATVTYVLGATVVDGVVLHDPEVLSNLNYAEILPPDVVDEVVMALQEQGRADLIPDSLRLNDADESGSPAGPVTG